MQRILDKMTDYKYPKPNKYPLVLIVRSPEYQDIDLKIGMSFENIQFSYEIVDYNPKLKDFASKIEQSINKLYCEEYNILITYGVKWDEYDISKYMIPKIFSKWFHISSQEEFNINLWNQRIMNCFIHYVPQRDLYRPTISCFTTSFKSFEKILRPFNSLKLQTYKDWEWVIIDDSDDDRNFRYIKEHVSSKDYRIRYFRKDYNNGNIGNVKNEAVSLCRGKYVFELDHDDEILPDTLEEVVRGFEQHPEVGFIYMNFAECYEDMKPFTYGNSWGFGYGGYYQQYYRDTLFEVATSVDINDVTMSNIVGVPNHPRVWRKSVLMEIGNYSECLPIADDYELLVLTCLKTKMMKINKLGYIQYKNKDNNNFSLIRNYEITKLQNHISHSYYNRFQIPEFFKNQGVQERVLRENKCINITLDTCLNPMIPPPPPTIEKKKVSFQD